MRLYNLGLACLIMAGLTMGQHLNSRANKRLDELWATAYDEGFDAGARAAREDMRPIVVPIDIARSRRPDTSYGRHSKTAQREMAGERSSP